MNAKPLADLIHIIYNLFCLLTLFLYLKSLTLQRYHSSRECSALQQLKYPLHTPHDDDDILIVKLLIRILCARDQDYDSSRFQTFMLLSDHTLDYDEKKWEEMENLWNLVRELEGEEDRGMFSEPKEEVLTIISKIRSNFFGIWSMSGKTAVWSGASVYLRCSFFNHSCFPNCLVAQESKPTQQQVFSYKVFEKL